ncbi:MAG: sugar kinase [Aliishimia sp.]
MSLRVACIGEAMIELSMQGDAAGVGVAGDSLNTAIYLKRVAPDIQVDYITRLGVDALSDRIHDFAASQGIGTSAITRDPNGTPGLYAISLREDGERSFTYWRSAAAARGMFGDGDFSGLDDYDLIYLSGISLAILPAQVRADLLAHIATSGIRMAFDSNYRPKLWEDAETARAMCRAFFERCDIALPSIDDEMALFEETEDQVTARCTGMRATGALKRGAQGPLGLGEDVTQTYDPAAKVVDTTAAGDSFNGAYLGALLAGKTQAEALLAGHNMAATVVQHRGAIIPADAGPV